MKQIKRRSFLAGAASSLFVTGMTVSGDAHLTRAHAKTRSAHSKKNNPHIVVIGGGAGGATVANFLSSEGGERFSVTMIEAENRYSASFFSNQYLAGFRSHNSLVYGYENLKSLGVDFLQMRATRIEPEKKKVILEDENHLNYDVLVLSPGVDFRYDTIEGIANDSNAAGILMHAWGNGAQVATLRAQLLDMTDGENILVSAPLGPCKGRIAIYERVSMLAHFIKTFRPSSKILFLDPYQDTHSVLFQSEWKKHYDGIIEWVQDPKEAVITRVDYASRNVFSASGQKYKAQILNIIPEQRAGDLVFSSGLTKGLWCPINPENCQSKLDANIFVLGDAANTGALPKSASAAFSQARIVASSILAKFGKKNKLAARYKSVSWPLVSTNNALKFGGSFVAGEKGFVETGIFGSSKDESAAVRAAYYQESLQWLKKARQNMVG